VRHAYACFRKVNLQLGIALDYILCETNNETYYPVVQQTTTSPSHGSNSTRATNYAAPFTASNALVMSMIVCLAMMFNFGML
jgi:hypothetical protein